MQKERTSYQTKSISKTCHCALWKPKIADSIGKVKHIFMEIPSDRVTPPQSGARV